jgi:hypothetical protein
MWNADGSITSNAKCLRQTQGYQSKFLANSGAMLPEGFCKN